MHKKLFKCGNSMALTIDATTRRLLRLDENTLLHVTLEGSRIVIQKSTCDRPPVVEPAIANATVYNRRLLSKLLTDLDRAGFTRAQFERLRHDDIHLFTLHVRANQGQPVDAVNVARLETALGKCRGGLSLDAAIQEALAEIPSLTEPIMLTATTETIDRSTRTPAGRIPRQATRESTVSTTDAEQSGA